MTTPHSATRYTNPAQSTPAETEAAQAAEVEASAGLYDRSFKSTKEQYQDLTGTQEPTPTVSGINPTTAVEGEGPVTITFTGTGFIAESIVSWGATVFTPVVNSATELKVVVPDGVAGDYDLFVDNGESKVSDAVTFTYSAAV